jgi:hypothetical protein
MASQMKTFILTLIACSLTVAEQRGIANDSRTVLIRGHLMDASFGIDSEYKGPAELRPDPRWNDRDCYYLQINGPNGPFYGKIIVQRGVNPKRTPAEDLQNWLGELRQSYKEPIGRVAKIITTNSREFPILAFTGTGGKMTLATLYFNNQYKVTIIFNEDLSSPYPSQDGFTHLVGIIGRSFEVLQMRQP